MRFKLLVIVIVLGLIGSFSACSEEEVAPTTKKEKAEYQNSPEYDGIPESDAHTDPDGK